MIRCYHLIHYLLEIEGTLYSYISGKNTRGVAV